MRNLAVVVATVYILFFVVMIPVWTINARISSRTSTFVEVHTLMLENVTFTRFPPMTSLLRSRFWSASLTRTEGAEEKDLDLRQWFAIAETDEYHWKFSESKKYLKLFGEIHSTLKLQGPDDMVN